MKRLPTIGLAVCVIAALVVLGYRSCSRTAHPAPTAATSSAANARDDADAGAWPNKSPTDRPAGGGLGTSDGVNANSRAEVRSLVVRTQTARDRPGPSGRSIALFAQNDAGRRRVWTGRTDRAGSVSVPVELVDRVRANGEKALVALAIPTAIPIIVRVPESLPATVELATPWLGRTHIDLVERATGTHFQSPRQVFVRALEPGERLGQHPPPAATWWFSRTTRRGRCQIEPVGNQARLMIWVGPLDATVDAIGAGPFVYASSSGQSISISVDADGVISQVCVAANVVDQQGRPVVDRPLRAMMFGDLDSMGAFHNALTDGAGRTRIPITQFAADIVLEVRPYWLQLSTPRLGTCCRPIPVAAPDATIIDLPTFTLGEDTTICRGTIRDARGRPIEGAAISVEYARRHEQRTSWRAVDHASARSASDGSFAVLGALAGELRLRVVKQGYGEPAPIPFQPGASGLSIELSTGGGLMAWIAEDDVGIRGVTFSLDLLDAAGTAARTFPGQSDRDGYYEWNSLPLGTYELVVAHRGTELHRFGDLRVIDGETLQPPRLQDIPIRIADDWIELRLLDPDGRLLTHLSPKFLDPRTGVERVTQHDAARSTGYTLRTGPAKAVIVEVPGYERVQVDAAPHAIDVHLIPKND